MNEPDIDTETSVDSLGDDLSAGFADFGTETSTDTPEKPAPAADATAQETPASGEAEKALEALEAPKHWAEADKTLWSKAPPELQKRWIQREAEQQKGLDAKFQEIAPFRKEREQLDQLFAPLARDLELNGIDRTQFMTRLVGAHKYLVAEPQKAIHWLAEQYGVDLSKLNEQQQSNPQDTHLMKALHGLESRVNGFVTAQQQQEHQTNLGKVESFADAKDEKGNPKHPHFDEVAADVLTLMKAGTKDLDVAYNKAIRMNDEVWAKVQSAKKADEVKAAATKRLEDINKAKRAGVTSEVREAKPGLTKPTTLKDDLSTAFASWQN